MHLLALGAFWHHEDQARQPPRMDVLMHLLALGAFWHKQTQTIFNQYNECLNAPFGARCFLAQTLGEGFGLVCES